MLFTLWEETNGCKLITIREKTKAIIQMHDVRLSWLSIIWNCMSIFLGLGYAYGLNNTNTKVYKILSSKRLPIIKGQLQCVSS